MNFSALFIRRPVATLLLAVGVLLSGFVAYGFLPVSPLPSIDIPAIVVFAARPGANPETMATSVAGPLERRLGEIAGLTELTSTSVVGATTVVALFDVDRSIDGAAHDVQAAINAATTDLPSDLPTRPYFRKFNPADSPIITIGLTSDTLSMGQVYDAADSVLAQRLSQLDGVAQVQVNGAQQPAVRVQLDPAALAAAGLSGQDVAAAIRAANVTQPVGGFEGRDRAETIGVNGQLMTAKDYRPIVLKQNNGVPLQLGQVARVIDGVANTRLAGWSGQRPALLVSVTKTAGANIIKTVERVKAALPQLKAWMPPGIAFEILVDRTATIRASIDDVQITLVITVALVLLVVLLFMRRAVPTIAAGVTVPLAISGTLAGMWFEGFALDNFSLMAITISIGFVVDDAIVMIENIVRHIEMGERPLTAALNGSRQIGFTVLSISISLVAVFIPVLFMGGIFGRLLREFSVTLTMAIAISALVSLSLTPMMCARLMRAAGTPGGLLGRIDRAVDGAFNATIRLYARSLAWALRRRWLMLGVTLGVVVLTVGLYRAIPKAFLPVQDTGLISGTTQADPSISFHAMEALERRVVEVVLGDPAVATIGSSIGVSSGFASLNRGSITIQLKPVAERHLSSEEVIARLRPRLAAIGGMQTFLYSVQDIQQGGRSGGSNQFVLLDADLGELRVWTERLAEKLRGVKALADISSDQDRSAPQATAVIDRVAAARLGVTVQAVDDALNNAFSQRQVSIIYTDRNQYRVVLEVDPKLQTDPSYLNRIFVGATNGTQVPLGSVVRVAQDSAPLAVRHQGQFPASTISYSPAPGVAEGDALAAVKQAAEALHMPETVHAEFAGNAKFLAQSLASEPYLIAAAFLAIYIILGVLYESLAQPLTIISTLPSAGLGALLSLLVTGMPLSIMGIIGILLLMGIVKKNAIMLVDFALEQERRHGRSPFEAIHAACIERFRPIIMTTLAAMLGALPLAVSFGTGSELRRPLGISIFGGLVVSQALTLYTTPVIYLLLQRKERRRAAALAAARGAPAPAE
jgi:multidrug efflux pump